MKESHKPKISDIDVLELACFLVGFDINKIDFEERIESALYEKYKIESIENFTDLIQDLMPLITISKSDFTNSIRVGFADKKNRVFLCKFEIGLNG